MDFVKRSVFNINLIKTIVCSCCFGAFFELTKQMIIVITIITTTGKLCNTGILHSDI